MTFSKFQLIVRCDNIIILFTRHLIADDFSIDTSEVNLDKTHFKFYDDNKL